MADSSPGALTALLFEVSEASAGAGHTYDANSYAIEFHRCSVVKHARIVGGNGITGRFTTSSSRKRGGAYYIYGEVVMDVSPQDIFQLAPLILGGTFWADGQTISTYEEDSGSPGSADPDAPVVDVPYFGILADLVADIRETINCKVNRAILRGRAPQFNEDGEPDLMKLYLEIFAQRESLSYTTSWPSPAPTFGDTLAYEDYVFQDFCSDGGGQVTINGSDREIMDFVLSINNYLYPRYTNCPYPSSIRPRNRHVGFACRVPYDTDNLDLLGMDPEGQAATIKLANATVSTTISLPKLHVPEEGVIIPGKQELAIVLQGEAAGLTDAAEITIVNDKTP